MTKAIDMDQTMKNRIRKFREKILETGLADPDTICFSLKEGTQISGAVGTRFFSFSLGSELQGDLQMHSAVYKKHPKFRALIHVCGRNILTAARAGRPVKGVLDDFVQIIGPNVRMMEASDDPAEFLRALKRRNAVLVKNQGAICAGADPDDCLAAGLVLEKGCRAVIESFFLGGAAGINWFEARLMRFVYQFKYSKRGQQAAGFKAAAGR